MKTGTWARGLLPLLALFLITVSLLLLVIRPGPELIPAALCISFDLL